jgi:copper chaperone CopZ
MNPFVRLCTLLLLLVSGFAHAADPAPVFQYKGEIVGVACAACSKQVRTALLKLPGVSQVKVVPTATSGLATLEITSTSDAITKDSAIRALGKQAEDYQIQKLTRETAPR